MRKSLIPCVVALALLTGGCDWWQWGSDPGRSFSSVAEGGISKQVVATFRPANLFHGAPTGQVITANGRAFVLQEDSLTEVDASTGTVEWTATLPSGSTAGGVPAFDPDSGTVFVVVSQASGATLLGFDTTGARNCDPFARQCTPVFSAAVGSASAPATPVLIVGGSVLVNGASELDAFDAGAGTHCTTSSGLATCTPLWSAPTGYSAAGVGPAATTSTVYDVVDSGSQLALGAFDLNSGSRLWTAAAGSTVHSGPTVSSSGTVFLPGGTGSEIRAYAGAGCGASTCSALFSLVRKAGDPAGAFLGSVALDGASVLATNANGRLYAWNAGGCGASTCTPVIDHAVNLPSGGSTDYSQTPAVASGVVFLLALRPVSQSDHLFMVAIDHSNGAELASWDLLARRLRRRAVQSVGRVRSRVRAGERCGVRVARARRIQRATGLDRELSLAAQPRLRRRDA